MAPSSSKYCDYCHKRGHNVKTCWVKQRARMEMAEQFLGEMSIAIKREHATESKIREGEKSAHEDDETDDPLPEKKTLQAIGKRLVDEQIAKDAAQAQKREFKRAKRQRARCVKAKRKKEAEVKGRKVSKTHNEKKREVAESVLKAT